MATLGGPRLQRSTNFPPVHSHLRLNRRTLAPPLFWFLRLSYLCVRSTDAFVGEPSCIFSDDRQRS